MKNEKFFLSISIILASIIISVGWYLTGVLMKKDIEEKVKEVENVTKEIQDVNPQKEFIIGDKDKADFFVVNYIDLECLGCKNFYKLEKKLIEKYQDYPRIAFVFRQMPLYKTYDGKNPGIHKSAGVEAMAVKCAGDLGGQKAYFEMIEKIFDETSSDGEFPVKILPNLAEEIGLDKVKFSECLDSPKTKEWLEKNWEIRTKKEGIVSTPTIYIYVKSTGQKVKIDPNLDLIERAIRLYLNYNKN